MDLNDMMREWGLTCRQPALLASLLSIFLFVVFVRKQVRYYKLLAPGPCGIPIFGILPFIKEQFHHQFYFYSRKYGDVFCCKMGLQTVVVLNNPKIIKKALARSEFSVRPNTALGTILDGYGIISSDGDLWTAQRRFLHKQKFGLRHSNGNIAKQMELRVQHEVKGFLSAVACNTNKPLNPEKLLNCYIANIICSLTMSTRFDHDDEVFHGFMNRFDEGFRLFTQTGAMIFIPALRFLPNISQICNKLMINRNAMLTFVREVIDEHQRTLDPNAPRDLVDTYLIAIIEGEQNGTTEELFSSKDPYLQLQQVLLDLFSAGVETLKTTFQWALLHLIHNPQVKLKIQSELDDVVGANRLPAMSDMPYLTYTRATIYEVIRRSTVVPMGTTHAVDRNVMLEGFLIPKNAQVIPNIYAVHMSPELWEEPETFNPNRFIDPNDETVLVKPKHFIPFGTGQRMCLGDNLAEMELQLFFASILHIFDIENPGAPDAPLPSLEGTLGATVTPKAFEVNFIPRNIEPILSPDLMNKMPPSPPSEDVRAHG